MKYIFVAVLLMANVLCAKESKFSLSTSLVGMNMDYTEHGDNNEFLDSEKSNFWDIKGIELGFAYKKVTKKGNYSEFGVNMMSLSGETEYVGTYLISGDPAVSTTKNILFDTEVDYKFTQILKRAFSLTYGVGIGYRSWRRELSPSQVEVYSWYSLRPKIGFSYSLKDFSFATQLEYQSAISPKMTILKDSENPDTTVNLGSADIIEISIPIKYSVRKNIDLLVEYVYQNQSIEKSDTAQYIISATQYTIYEPASTAHNQYVKFGAIFKF